MVITWYGEGCFKIQSGEVSILTDPIDNKSGLNAPRFKSDIILKTLSSVDLLNEEPNNESKEIFGAGEYNLKDVDISGFQLEKESTDSFLKTIYVVNFEGIKLCFLGHLSESLDPDIEQYLENIDILFVPAGGDPFIDQKAVFKIIKQIEPKIVIPSFFKIPSLKRQSNDLKIFLEEFNGQKIEPQEKLSIKKKDLEAIKKIELAILKV